MNGPSPALSNAYKSTPGMIRASINTDHLSPPLQTLPGGPSCTHEPLALLVTDGRANPELDPLSGERSDDPST